MNPREKGFLLLTSHLGDPERKPLTTAQLRTLTDRVRNADIPDGDRKLHAGDLVSLGYSREMARRIVELLEEEDVLEHYLQRGARLGCVPITRVNPEYPLILRQRLGLDSPGCLWVKGDLALLNTPAIALVGSRELREENRDFAAEVGRQAAIQGLTLVSGNARGSDRTAQNACLASGGRVISVVADELAKQPLRENVLYVSEEDFDEPFSAIRALSRNRVIHALGRMVFVAQSDLGKGGTWDGTVKNLRFGWSPVACCRDGSEASFQLEQMGAYLIEQEDIRDFGSLLQKETTLFDR
ncbi:MAG: DNA-protecting protein DprA [Oscillospiraceae bacterium]|nr:DNA-protecting protein DprA [Oscillospiraceae bacterium]